MALAHKGLSAETIPWCFTDKAAIAPHKSDKVPVLLDGETSVANSWAIANYLEDNYPDRPSLFGGEAAAPWARMMNWWGDVGVVGGMFPLIVADIPAHLKPVDAGLFPQHRARRGSARRWKRSLAGRDKSVEGFRRSLDPMRLTLKTQPFLGGAAPNYADYIVFGGIPMGARGQPVQAAGRKRSGLRLARKAARCVRRHGAEIAGSFPGS